MIGAVSGGMDPQQAIISGGGPTLSDSNGVPWNGRYTGTPRAGERGPHRWPDVPWCAAPVPAVPRPAGANFSRCAGRPAPGVPGVDGAMAGTGGRVWPEW